VTLTAAPLVGVLALQGAFLEHVRALEAVGARTRLVRLPADLEALDALVIPGGESTTMTILLERMGLWEPLREALEGGLPALATCAGMILLAREITDGVNGQHGLGLRRDGQPELQRRARRRDGRDRPDLGRRAGPHCD